MQVEEQGNFAGAEHFCPNFPKLARKMFVRQTFWRWQTQKIAMFFCVTFKRKVFMFSFFLEKRNSNSDVFHQSVAFLK